MAAGARVLGRALLDPAELTRRLGGLVGEIALVLAGRSDRKPEPTDRRFIDETWRDHPVYRRWMQAYLAWRDAMLGLVDERRSGREEPGARPFRVHPPGRGAGARPTRCWAIPGRSSERSRPEARVCCAVPAICSPTCAPTRPAVPGRREAFTVGKNLAATPGAVVHRSEVLELLQYRPQTGEVFERPILLIPPQVNKFYVTDLAPGRSLVEFLVQQGFQTFVVSWRNPMPAQRDWGLDAYIQALVHALDAIAEITGSTDVNLLGACAGGITTAVLLGHLAARGDDRVRSATFPVTVLDTSAPSMVGMLTSEQTVASARRAVRAAAACSGAATWRASLRGCGRTISCGTTGSTTTCSATRRRRSTSSTGTPTPRTSRRPCMPSSSTSSSRTTSCGRGTLAVLGTPIDLGAVRCDVYTIGA